VSAEPTAAARRLADRLSAEGVSARAQGSCVRVAPQRWAQAVTLAALFHEVDTGCSRIAPPPASSWNGSFPRQLLAVLLLALVVVPSVALALLALAG
jgi:hypothetical protein